MNGLNVTYIYPNFMVACAFYICHCSIIERFTLGTAHYNHPIFIFRKVFPKTFLNVAFMKTMKWETCIVVIQTLFSRNSKQQLRNEKK